MTSLAVISNLFTGDGLIIFLILLLLFGAKKLPELAKGLGSAVREFSKAKDEIHHEMTRAAEPQTPQIEAPRYTEPHVASGDYHHAEEAAPHVSAPAQPVAAATTPLTEEHHNRPV